MLSLLGMRMVCDSTFLIDKEPHVSPKLVELKEILIEKMDLKIVRVRLSYFLNGW